MSTFFKHFATGLLASTLAAAQQYIAGADWTQVGLWAGVAGAVAGLLAAGLGKLAEKLAAR